LEERFETMSIGRVPERLTNALARDRCVRVAVRRSHELAAVAMPELNRDLVILQAEHVERVPIRTACAGKDEAIITTPPLRPS